ncbi:FMN-binding protein [Holdemania massiliensis]|uniref:FMN-binding protein n=3 Tax=Holdemania massiliensis TaxID=1468449 RepID=A0A6N7S303_9FIRM|nr:FMN-binding protein [Holdemania massiliensis]MSA72660.1 FMN-binding protein [Holdemania massiliensis]MSA88050.1 FMN-binding protein [Holdemania massiliensis]MSB79745.1 FMN-binding protein [Holdemania massiliensis]MSC34666.1 FMN-binding protein [Holdemania massiliensis]MSC41055.1 FMN-binding protein [Holdemania massiliensis]
MKKTLYLACFLAIVSALAGGLLAAVNEVTAAKINANALAEVMGSLEKVFPGTTYAEVTEYTDESGLVTGVYQAEGQGYMFQVETSGFKDTIKFVLGINNDSKIVGYDVISISETSGIGSRVAEDDFRNTVIGKTTGDKVDALSGATISSSAVIKGLDAAKAVYASLTGNAAPAPSTPTAPETTKEPEASASAATVLDQQEDGSQVTVTVEAKGFQGNNTYTVVIDKDNQEVLSVAMTTFNDTPGVGDVVNDEYLAGFAGLNTAEAIGAVDVKSGATYTSNSAIDAVKAAWNAVFTEEADQPTAGADNAGEDAAVLTSADGALETYTVKGKGFQGDNEYEVVIDTEKQEVVSVKMTTFNDTPGVGDTVNDDYLAGFAGLKSEDEIAKVDVKSGATFTSNSAIEAVRAAFAASQK